MSAYRKNFRLHQRLANPRAVLLEDLTTGEGVVVQENEVTQLGTLAFV